MTAHDLSGCCGTVISDKTFENDSSILLCFSLSSIGKNNEVYVKAIKPKDHFVKSPKTTQMAQFKVLQPKQTEQVRLVSTYFLSVAKMRSPVNFMKEFNQLIIVEQINAERQTKCPAPDYSKLWFPTPETWSDASN